MSEISGQGEEGWYMYKKDLIYCLLVLEVQCPRQTSLEEHHLEIIRNKISAKVGFKRDPWCMPYAPQQKPRRPNLFPDLRRQNSRC